MSYLKYLENKQHETGSFPIAYYRVDSKHPLYVMSLHWHKEAELLYVRSGEMRLSINGVDHLLKKGELCYIPDGYIHGGVPQNCVYECIDFDLNSKQLQIYALREMLGKISGDKCAIFTKFTSEHPRILKCVERIFENVRKQNEGWEIFVLSGLLEMYGTIFRERCYHESNGNVLNTQKLMWLKPVLEYIDKNYQQPISLDDLSHIAGMSPQYFCRVFRDIVRKTPVEYINEFRLEKACELLQKKGHSVTEVAFLCGFNDSCYFTRCFKRYKGITPKRYEKTRDEADVIAN